MLTHTGFQLFPVSYIFGNLENTIKYSMHRISKIFIFNLKIGPTLLAYFVIRELINHADMQLSIRPLYLAAYCG